MSVVDNEREVDPANGTEVVPDESSPVTPSFFSNEEFQRRVNVVMEAITDPEKERRCIAEIHTYLSLFDNGMRQFMVEMAQTGGPMGMMKAMMGRGK